MVNRQPQVRSLTPSDAQFAVPVDIQTPFKLAKQHVISEFERRYISRLLEHHDGATPAGALLFSCLGRGEMLYGEPDHDSRAFRAHIGDVPLGGFFGNGEIGPVHGQTFLHGYRVEPLAKTGLSDKRLMCVDYTLKVLNEKAHAVIADIDPTAPVTP